jgi:hypothetical protein
MLRTLRVSKTLAPEPPTQKKLPSNSKDSGTTSG